MNAKTKGVAFLVLVAVVAACSTWLAAGWLRRTRPPEDAHAWIHRQLAITDEQEIAIAATEHRFFEKQKELTRLIRQANKELADAMLEAKGPSAKVDEAIGKIHQAQADLQQATIEHVFEMREALRPDQYDKLLSLTANALSGTPR